MFEVVSPYFGTLASLHAEEGAQVEEGEPIAELEAMKVYMRVVAGANGTLHWVAELGEVLGEGDVIAEIN